MFAPENMKKNPSKVAHDQVRQGPLNQMDIIAPDGEKYHEFNVQISPFPQKD